MGDTERYELRSIPEGAAYLGVKPTTVRRWIRLGILPCIRLGRRVLVDLADLNTHIRAHRHQGAGRD